MHITNQSVLTESGLIHFFKKLYNKPSLILTPIFLDPTQFTLQNCSLGYLYAIENT